VSHLLVETRSGTTAARFLADAVALARHGGQVRLFLTADAVALGIRDASALLTTFVGAGGQVFVDEVTLAHRALRAAPLAPGVTPTGMAAVAEWLLTPDTRVVWH
jgi:sulfur relay (sulfurtransferase) complex TusBCD TusD component (DsrE family)